MVVLFLIPLLVFGVYSFLTNSLYEVEFPFTLEGYRSAVTSSVNVTLAKNSAWVGLGTAVVTVVLALPIAFWLRRSAGRWRLPVLFLITASMFAGYLVRIYAWRTILGRNGLINKGLMQLGVIDEPLGFLLYSLFSVTMALVHIFLPYVVLVLYAAMGPLGSGIIEAAQDLGANAPTLWRTRDPAVGGGACGERVPVRVHPVLRRLRHPAVPRRNVGIDARRADPDELHHARELAARGCDVVPDAGRLPGVLRARRRWRCG